MACILFQVVIIKCVVAHYLMHLKDEHNEFALFCGFWLKRTLTRGIGKARYEYPWNLVESFCFGKQVMSSRVLSGHLPCFSKFCDSLFDACPVNWWLLKFVLQMSNCKIAFRTLFFPLVHSTNMYFLRFVFA